MNLDGEVRFTLRPSRLLVFTLSVLYLLAAGCVAVAAPAPLGWVLAPLVVAHGLYVIRRDALLRGRGALQALSIRRDSGLEIERIAMAAVAVDPARVHVVHRWMVAIAAGSRPVLVTADMLDREPFRLLRMWLLWQRLPGRPVQPAALHAMDA